LLVEMRGIVGALKKQGSSFPEIAPGKPGADYDAEWYQAFINPNPLLDRCIRAFEDHG
jgi:hypothetical protein